MKIISMEMIISGAALLFSMISLFISYRIEKHGKKFQSYFDIERAALELFRMPIENDILNKIYFNKIDTKLPAPTGDFKSMTKDERSILHYGTILLAYFEQLVELAENKELPEGVKSTWDTWILECCECPYFIWVWDCLKGHYLPALAIIIESNRFDMKNDR